MLKSVPAAVLMIIVGLLPGGSAGPYTRTPGPAPATGAVVALVNASSPAGNLFNGQFCGGVLVSPPWSSLRPTAYAADVPARWTRSSGRTTCAGARLFRVSGSMSVRFSCEGGPWTRHSWH